MSQLARFEALLRRAAELGAAVRIVPMINATYGDVEAYAHIEGHDSDTVDFTIDNGPALTWLDLTRRAAQGLTGEAATEISQKSASFTRRPLSE